MLTATQTKTLEFIKRYIKTSGYAPTTGEIATGIGIKSRGVVHRYVHALAEQGYLRVIPKRRRNIQLIEKSLHKSLLPLIGTIAAGEPIEAVPQHESIDIVETFLGDDRFILKVKGDSMINDGIFNGDLVVCQQSKEAEDGKIVVALIDGQEATLKRLQRNSDDTITLIPANVQHSPMIYQAERVQVQGIFVGLMRLPN